MKTNLRPKETDITIRDDFKIRNKITKTLFKNNTPGNFRGDLSDCEVLSLWKQCAFLYFAFILFFKE